MTELYIIRHGFAGETLEDQSMDQLRPLKKKGRDKMKSLFKHLKEMNISFDYIFTSPLLRATMSAEIVDHYCGKGHEIMITHSLLPEATFRPLIKILNKEKNVEKIAIVGHEPFLSHFASFCLTNTETSFIHLKKSGLIVLEIDQILKPGYAKLSCLIEPSMILKP